MSSPATDMGMFFMLVFGGIPMLWMFGQAALNFADAIDRKLNPDELEEGEGE